MIPQASPRIEGSQATLEREPREAHNDSMAEVQGFLFVCDTAHVDQATRKLSVIGIFDRIRSRKFPFKYRSCTIVAKFACIEGEHEGAFYFKDPSGVDFMPPCKPVKFVSPPAGTTIVTVELKGLRFPKEGSYEVQMSVDGHLVKKTELTVDRVG
jgi:hypothetical protein